MHPHTTPAVDEVGRLVIHLPDDATFYGARSYLPIALDLMNGVKTPSSGWVDDVSTEYARQFLTENKDRPFSLVVGFKTCHGPFTPPERTAQTYGDAEARAVPNLGVKAVYRQEEAVEAAPQGKGKKRPIAQQGLAK